MAYRVVVKRRRQQASARTQVIGWLVLAGLTVVSWLAVLVGVIPGP